MKIKNKIIFLIYKIYKIFVEKTKNKKDNIDELILSGVGGGGLNNKTALLSYSMSSLLSPDSKVSRSIGAEMMEILNILIDCNYKVTVVDCKKQFLENSKFDLIVGFGCSYRLAKIKLNGKRVLYLTEGLPSISEVQEKKRVKRFNKKYGINVGVQRSNVYYIESDVQVADAIICLGDGKRREQIKANYGNKIIKGIYPSVYLKGGYRECEKQNKRIVMISSGGVVHKGVDITYESIAKLDGVKLDHFGALGYLKYVIEKPNNVNQHGFVDLNKEKYQNIMRKARFVILLSASEACPTSVINAMRYGCIPIVSDNCGMNEMTIKAGYLISEIEPDKIQSKIKEIINQPQEVLNLKSQISSKLVEQLNISNYSESFKDALQIILNDK